MADHHYQQTGSISSTTPFNFVKVPDFDKVISAPRASTFKGTQVLNAVALGISVTQAWG